MSLGPFLLRVGVLTIRRAPRPPAFCPGAVPPARGAGAGRLPSDGLRRSPGPRHYGDAVGVARSVDALGGFALACGGAHHGGAVVGLRLDRRWSYSHGNRYGKVVAATHAVASGGVDRARAPRLR